MQRLSRRNFLAIVIGGLGAGGLAGAMTAVFGHERRPATASATSAHRHPPSSATAAPTTTGPRAATPARGASLWSDPRSWAHGVPGAGDVAVVSRRVMLDVDARVAGVVVEPGGELSFDPAASRTLRSTGNVVVKGRLVMRPRSAAQVHQLVLQGANEHRFAGGGMDVLPSDVGLWVVGAGALDLAGAPRRAWTRAAGSLAAGATSLTLVDDPSGWAPGDELVVTPTLAPAGDSTFTAHDTAVVKSVSGRRVTLDRALEFAHPGVDLGVDAGSSRIQTAEVLNLTRNVRIEGTAGHRAHIFIRATRPQSLKGVAIRHMGPRKPTSDGFTESVLGRYGLHFHMADNGARGSVVDGVVIRDTGSHAFVAHQSHGVTFRDCISHDTIEDAYWWDGAPDTRTPGPPSNDIVYERCVASLVRYDPDFRGFTLTGFMLGRGSGSVARDCVAVGVQGSVNAAGFQWPEGSEGIWTFERCVAHNNAKNGIFVWQNTGKTHLVTQFTAYHNLGAGISHGAYNNRYSYRDSALYGNVEGAMQLHADSWGGPGSPLQFVDLTCNGAGVSDYLVVAPKHNGDNEAPPPRFVGCSFRGARKAAFGWTYQGEDGPSTNEIVDIIDCRFAGNEFWLASGIGAGSHITVRDPAHGSIVLRRADQAGTFRAQWNARVG
jgi:hypothetical protein